METLTPQDIFTNTTPIPFLNGTDASTRPPCIFTRVEFFGYFIVQPVICVVGFVLNIINVSVFITGKQFSGSSTYRLMMILSIFDAITLLLTFPQSFVRCKSYLAICTQGYFRRFRYAIFRWHVYAGLFLVNTSEGVSIWMTVLLSVERYISIKHHYIIKTHFSTSNVHKTVVFIIVVCAVINSPLCFVQTLTPIYKNATINDSISATALGSNETIVETTEKIFGGYQAKLSSFGRSSYYHAFSWMRIIFFNFIPLIFLSCVNAFLIYIVRSSGHFRKHSSQARSGEKRMKAQRNLTILLVTVIFLFLTGQIPQAFAYVQVFRAVRNCKYHQDCCIFYNHYRLVTNIVCLITYATNFFIYQTLNKHFRAEISRLCRVFHARNPGHGTTSEAVEMMSRQNQNDVGPSKIDGKNNAVNGEVYKEVVIHTPLNQ